MLLSLLSKRSLDVDSRDAYGFTVRPQHLERFREYGNVYKQEEEERSNKWQTFLEQHAESAQPNLSVQENFGILHAEVTEPKIRPVLEVRVEGDDSSFGKLVSDRQVASETEKVILGATQTKLEVKRWAQVRPSLNAIENLTSFHVNKGSKMKDKPVTSSQSHFQSIEEVKHYREDSKEELEEAFMDCTEAESAVKNGVPPEPFFPFKEELEVLVRGGVPKDLRGEVWQAFVGVRIRRVERYYQDLLDPDDDDLIGQENNKTMACHGSKGKNGDKADVPEKCRKQIEKDLHRTFPGHPALNENGRNSLRRVLAAYARHNPTVGYCQAMNFFAGLLLLMMPEENAFWTLVGIIDDYFDGYFSMEMIESQVDQLVFEDLVRERFPKLVNHLDYLGVQVAWFSGPWFLSIFVNMLPWESVLRVWDVLLFEGNRVMLFRTALALMELYGPAIGTTKDAGDAITLLQSLTGSTFDSSQLVLTACMGFLTVTEDKLQQLRKIHRPAVLEAMEERSKGGPAWKDSKGLASKLYSFKHDPESLVKQTSRKDGLSDKVADGDMAHLGSPSTNLDDFISGMCIDSEVDSLPDLQEQVVWLKVELCKMLEEKRSAELRAEELETAFIEMVKQDNRRQLSARVEQLEQEVAELRQVLADKKEQEHAMLQVLMRLEQEMKVTEDARLFAEQEAAAQRYAVQVIQEKYDKAMTSVAKMEQRVVMAESMLEATLQYETGQTKAQSSPRSQRPDSSQETPTKKAGLLSFGLGWRDRNKAKPPNPAAASEAKTANEAKPPNFPSPRDTKPPNLPSPRETKPPNHASPEETKPPNLPSPREKRPPSLPTTETEPTNLPSPPEIKSSNMANPVFSAAQSETKSTTKAKPANAAAASETESTNEAKPADTAAPDDESTMEMESNRLQETLKIR